MFIARVAVGTVGVTRAVSFPKHRHRTRSGGRPFRFAQTRRNRVAVVVVLIAKVFRKPALIADEHRRVVVALVAHGIAAWLNEGAQV